MPACCDRRTFLRRLFFAPPGAPDRRTLVVVFLRGGADGLNMVVPHFEKAYYSMRPTLSIAKRDTLDLDGRFGFHREFAPLLPLFSERRLAVVHAVGSDDDTRSHFEAQDLMERAGRFQDGTSGGWLARHLRARAGAPPAAVAAIAMSTFVPESLRGGPAAAIASLEDLSVGGRNFEPLRGALRTLYAGSEDPIEAAGRDTLDVMDRLRGLEASKAGDYPDGAFGHGLAQVAALIRAQVGLEVATVDLDGWDTHFTQGAASGLLAGKIRELASGLAAFAKDLGEDLDRALVVVQTEFGRRAYENASFGTDHGRGSVMLALGGGVAGGRVVTDWPGLEGDALEGPGDLPVTIDYRDVLGEILSRSLGNAALDRVFPGFEPRFRGVIE
jgi:uncharacterized protein (DUF1501 family)